MSTDSKQDDDALLEELAHLVERLRTSRYEQVILRVREAPTTLVEDFADLLSRHLLFEEDILFPALRESAPPRAGQQLDGLKQEHGTLRDFARDLVLHVHRGDVDAACDIGRLFMAALLDHIQRESRVTRRILSTLDLSTAARLKITLSSDPPPVP